MVQMRDDSGLGESCHSEYREDYIVKIYIDSSP